jgi:trehalose 6-phosphate synthase/phosphatase
MFRALIIPPGPSDALVMQPPTSAAILEPSSTLSPVELAIVPEAIFATTVGPSSKKTLAHWHVTSPQEIVEAMASLVGNN